MATAPVIETQEDIYQQLADGAALLINISGGKDSDAMANHLLVERRRHNWTGPVYLVHADLKRADWENTLAYVKSRAQALDVPLAIVAAKNGDLFDGIRRRMNQRPDAPPFPSPSCRYCTSNYKRGPIETWIRNTFPSDQVIINAMGFRKEESKAREKRPAIAMREKATAKTKNRYTFDWLPIHDWKESQVWDAIGHNMDELTAIREAVRDARMIGLDPLPLIDAMGFKAHRAYALGNQRLSCALCVLASPGDIANGAEFNPNAYRELVQIEIDSGFQFTKRIRLADVFPAHLTDAQRQAIAKADAAAQ